MESLLAIIAMGWLMSSSAEGPLPCSQTRVDIAAGDRLFADQLVGVECRGARVRGLIAYRREQGHLIARNGIAAGTYLGRVSAPERPVVSAGDAVDVTAQIGVARVRRTVTAVQDAHAGRSFFVIDEDGRVFVAPPLQRQENPE